MQPRYHLKLKAINQLFRKGLFNRCVKTTSVLSRFRTFHSQSHQRTTFIYIMTPPSDSHSEQHTSAIITHRPNCRIRNVPCVGGWILWFTSYVVSVLSQCYKPLCSLCFTSVKGREVIQYFCFNSLFYM